MDKGNACNEPPYFELFPEDLVFNTTETGIATLTAVGADGGEDVKDIKIDLSQGADFVDYDIANGGVKATVTFKVIYDKAKVGNYKVTATVIDTRGKSTSKQFSITVIQPTY
jgi:hypothetical protein